MPAARIRPARPVRPTRPKAPPLPPFDALDATHRQILQVLDELQRLVAMISRPGSEAPAAVLARHACDFFNGPAHGHHEAEETRVFPSLVVDGDAALLAQVRRLQQDHDWLEEDWLELEPHLQAVAEGYRQEHHEFLHHALPEFITLYHEHIALEEASIYPEARRRQARQAAAA